MKKLEYILILIFLFSFEMLSQDTGQGYNEISLSVILPDNSDKLSASTLSKIESKIQHIVTKNGISGTGYSNNFVIYPKMEVYDEDLIEGVRNIVVVEMEFNLFIQQPKTKKVFSAYNKTIRGSGFTRQKAINDGISKISPRDPRLKEFIREGKSKIIAYYENNCGQIDGDANALILKQQYNRAIAILNEVPREASKCYKQIQQKSIEAYQAYQEQNCRQNLLKSKAAIAANNFGSALRNLGHIDPNSGCAKEAKALIQEAAAKVDSKEQKEWNLMLKRHNDRQEMQKYRLQITKEIANSYYKSKPQTIIYKSLF